MNTLKTIALALTLFCFATSCKKDTVTPAPAPVSKKLQKITWSQDLADVQNFTYDAQGRLIKSEDDYTTNTYSYNANTVAMKEFRKSENRFVSDITGTTDNAGRMITNTGNFSYNINTPYTEKTDFVYDANGYLTQITRTSGVNVQTYDFTISNGDYIKLIYQKTSGGGYTRVTDFYTDKKDMSGLGSAPLSYANDHTGLFGKMNTHLVKFEQSTSSGSPTPSWTRNLTYTFDSNGYVLTSGSTGTWTGTGVYTYQ